MKVRINSRIEFGSLPLAHFGCRHGRIRSRQMKHTHTQQSDTKCGRFDVLHTRERYVTLASHFSDNLHRPEIAANGQRISKEFSGLRENRERKRKKIVRLHAEKERVNRMANE